MKKLHIFILKSYAGPLAMTFFISLFILVMQFLWRYVDDLVGKGLELHVMAELMFYASLQVVPMALPLAILLAALMTFGNLGENYELTAIKAAGISLRRVMAPLVVLTAIISATAFWFSNNVLPVANLKLYSLLYSVKQARPELDIKEKIYYGGVEGFRIKVDRKDKKTGMMYDLIIHDHRDKINRNVNVTMADSGQMVVGADKNHIAITLYSGITYDEKVSLGNSRMTDHARQMYRHDTFRQQTVTIELEGMDFSRSDENLFKTNDRMKNLEQLRTDADSLIASRQVHIDEIAKRTQMSCMNKAKHKYANDTLYAAAIDTVRAVNIDSLALRLTDRQKTTVVESALRTARDSKQFVDERRSQYASEQLKINRHEMEMHRKFTLPIACMLFFFIGAPLGAIIRKGGLGAPMVISILFFIFYYIIDTMGAKFAREGVWPVPAGIWLSTMILAPIGSFLTYKSATDSALLNSEAYAIFWGKCRKRLERWAPRIFKKTEKQTI